MNELTDAEKLASAEKRRRQDLASKKLGELMMKGWAMLADVCEDCNVPLMRNKQQEKLCVSCDKWTDKKGEPKKKSEQQSQPSQINSAPATSIITPLPKVAEIEPKDNSTSITTVAPAALPTTSTQPANTHTSTTPLGGLPNEPKATGNTNLTKVVQSKLAYLLARLESEQDIAQINNILSAIEKCQSILKC